MKHPVLSNKVRQIIWWLAWLFMALGQLLSYYLGFGKLTTVSISDIIISVAIYSVLALSLWYPFSFFNSATTRPGTIVTNIIAGGIISLTIWILLTRMIMLLLFPRGEEYKLYWEATFYFRIGSGVFIYCLVVLTYYLFISLTTLSEKKAKEARLESLVKETELRMLRSQINPHFLFNSLNSVSSLTLTDPEKARDMVVRLSEFMRYALSRKDEQPVTLRSELENLMLYLDIEKVRFGDRLSTEESIDPDCLEIKMPVLLLQPLYENAIKHGVYESTGGVKISTEAKIEEGHLKITISNNYDTAPSSRKGTGTGLQNVARRLELSYGNRASIRTSKEADLFTVTLYIPAEYL
ncbi:MAG: histidine kinase [Bacteroidales bacterium]|nr:histidine kinase [Bacteroidales bacterium]